MLVSLLSFSIGVITTLIFLDFISKKNPNIIVQFFGLSKSLLDCNLSKSLDDYNPILRNNNSISNKPLIEGNKSIKKNGNNFNTNNLNDSINNNNINNYEFVTKSPSPPINNAVSMKGWMHLSHTAFWISHYFDLKGGWLCYYSGN